MTKTHVTRTLGPIHFEDLDPHRFEDLVRQLAYDFRRWQAIESTGRGGADEGFDIRAYEALYPESTSVVGEYGGQEDNPHPMEGNLWMIQCKRERTLGPRRVEAIINETVNRDSPPYGYILAAPSNFSKAAHDKFREELRSRGVMEFYLWGSGELEDMLYQPKNDRILFAFFGISLTTRQRSRTTEIRAVVNAKNKLLRILDENYLQSVLLRDLKDASYPYEENCKDFAERPRWKDYAVVDFHPLGLIVSVKKYYAYFDKAKGEWDFTDTVNNAFRIHDDQRRRDTDKEELSLSVKGFWEMLPRARKAMFVKNGLIRFDSIAFIDDKGDSEYKCPHLFVDFHAENGPFSGFVQYLEINENSHESLEGLKRTKIFSEIFQKPIFGAIYKDKFVLLDDRVRKYSAGCITLYDPDKKYAYLKPNDVIGFEKEGGRDGMKKLLKIANRRTVVGKELLDLSKDNPPLKQAIENQIGRELKPGETIDVIEALVIYDWQIEQNRPVI
jgi:hypothetical protein